MLRRPLGQTHLYLGWLGSTGGGMDGASASCAALFGFEYAGGSGADSGVAGAAELAKPLADEDAMPSCLYV